MMKKDGLLAELKKNVQTGSAAETEKVSSAKTQRPPRQPRQVETTPVPVPAEPPTRQFTGRTLGFWGDDEDRKILRELALVLYQANLKPSESLAIRAALRLVSQEHRFGELVQQAQAVLERDGRRLRHPKETSQGKQ